MTVKDINAVIISKHMASAIAPSLVLAYFVGYPSAVLFALGSILIDIDHYLEYIIKKRSFNLVASYHYYANLHKDYQKAPNRPFVCNVFHSVEFLVILGVLGLFYREYLFLFLGCTFHVVLDYISLYYEKLLGIRAFSVLQYCWIKRNQARSNTDQPVA